MAADQIVTFENLLDVQVRILSDNHIRTSMEVNPTIKLCVDFTDASVPYWVEVTSDYDEGQVRYHSQGNEEFLSVLNANNELSLTLLIGESLDSEPYSNPLFHSVDLGSLDFSGETVLTITVSANGVVRGSGQVKVADAEQTAKPIL